MRALVCFVLFSFCAALPADAQVFRGVVGNEPIVAEISKTKDSVMMISYFKTDNLIDIFLEGIAKGDTIIASSEDSKVSWVIHKAGDSSWSGICRRGGVTTEVMLRPGDIATVSNPYDTIARVKEFKTKDTYNYIRSSLLKVTADKDLSMLNKRKVRYITESITGLRLLVVDNPANNKALAGINKVLVEQLFDAAIASCTSGPGYGGDVDYFMSLHYAYITENILSVVIEEGSNGYGQAHPEHYLKCLNFNLHTGNIVKLRDALHMSGPGRDFDMDKVTAILARLYPKQMNAAGVCNFKEDADWSEDNWWYTDKGIFLKPTFPYIINECGDVSWPCIPYKMISKTAR